jgi:hypothetical protein
MVTVSVFLLGLAANPGWAQPQDVSDFLSVTFSPPGAVPSTQTQTIVEGSADTDVPSVTTPIVFPAPASFSQTPILIHLTEPTSLSDILTVARVAGTTNLSFTLASDPLDARIPTGTPGCSATFVGSCQLAETGLNQNVTPFLGLNQTIWTVLVQSNVEPIPEPGTLLLLGSGLTGLVAWRRIKRL